jgi:hypothetical protein
MMTYKVRKMALFCCVVLFAACAAHAQVPGDGVPDLYYFSQDGLMADTSFGMITRPAGVMVLDSDGFDVNAVLIAGADVTTPLVTLGDGNVGCYLCEGMNLPQTSATSAGTYTVGYGGVVPMGSSQWIRTSPLQGSGFIGVVGTGFVGDGGAQPWPAEFLAFLDYPEDNSGLANYGPGLSDADFPRVFDDGTSEAVWSVRVASGATGDSLFTNVTVLVPEPGTGLLSFLGLAALGWIRRR